MIYELRTYDLLPNSVPEVERLFADAYEHRRAFSEMAASLHTEIGPLNQIIQLWPYADLAQRERLSGEASKVDGWPPDIRAFVVSESVEVFVPFDFSPAMKPGSVGPFFEVRTYEFAAGELPKIITAWEAALPERLQWSSLVVLCACEETNRLMHIWAYQSLDQRTEVRAKSREAGRWPPNALARKLSLPTYKLLHQENKIMLPSSCSPIQ